MSTVIYRRQSLDKKNDELGIERQLRECQRVAHARGLHVREVITDNSVSASKRGRPGYARLLDLMARRQVQTVIILRIDRLLRLNDELEELIQLVERHPVKVITVEGDVDLSTPQGRLVARILVSVARQEMEVKSARHKLANLQKAEQGLPHGARRAFGYRSDGVTLHETEAAVLRDIGAKFLAGWSYRELAAWLNAEGRRTAQGRQFYPITIRNMLTRKRYAAIREYQGVDYPAVWPAVFDAHTWARIQYTVAVRKDAAGNKPKAVRYLLTGLLTCGACGGPLNGETKRDHPRRPLRRTYQCRTCHGVTRGAEPLEHFIRELVIYRLDSADLAALLHGDKDDGRISQLTAEREALSLRLTQLVDDYADGTLTKPEFIRAKGRTQTALERVEGALLDVHRSAGMNGLLTAGESVRSAWDNNPDGWRRQLLGLLVEGITVQPGNSKPFYVIDGKTYRFDPRLVDIAWRA